MNTFWNRLSTLSAALAGPSWLTPAAATVAVLAAASCASDSSSTPTKTGIQTVVLKVDEGLIFETGEIVPGLKFNKVDLYATAGSDALTLKTGGSSATQNTPVNWFKTGTNVQKFPLLADVPNEKPSATQTEALTHAEQGHGFVAEGFISEGWARGFISKASEDSVTIEYVIITQ